MTVDISAPLLEALEAGTLESKLTLVAYVAEVLESHAATRRLPRVQRTLGSGRRTESPGDSFPWPVDTYRMHLPK